ncbi:putative heterogeneous nuclear ribonucleoprotein C-like, partial [Homarus americanus]
EQTLTVCVSLSRPANSYNAGGAMGPCGPRLTPPLKRPRLMVPNLRQQPRAQSPKKVATPGLEDLKTYSAAQVAVRKNNNSDNKYQMNEDNKTEISCKSIKVTSTEESALLLCALCKENFASAWDLMVHAQAAHMVNIYQLGSKDALQDSATCSTAEDSTAGSTPGSDLGGDMSTESNGGEASGEPGQCIKVDEEARAAMPKENGVGGDDEGEGSSDLMNGASPLPQHVELEQGEVVVTQVLATVKCCILNISELPHLDSGEVLYPVSGEVPYLGSNQVSCTGSSERFTLVVERYRTSVVVRYLTLVPSKKKKTCCCRDLYSVPYVSLKHQRRPQPGLSTPPEPQGSLAARLTKFGCDVMHVNIREILVPLPPIAEPIQCRLRDVIFDYRRSLPSLLQPGEMSDIRNIYLVTLFCPRTLAHDSWQTTRSELSLKCSSGFKCRVRVRAQCGRLLLIEE